jgi:transcription initiation factor IIF auxiliary subunit
LRKFKVSSISEEDDDDHDDGYLYFRWRIQLKFLTAAGLTVPSEPFVEKVVFELHPDFDKPTRGKQKKPPVHPNADLKS